MTYSTLKKIVLLTSGMTVAANVFGGKSNVVNVNFNGGNNGGNNNQASQTHLVRRAWNYFSESFPGQLVIGSAKCSVGAGAFYGAYVAGKPAYTSYGQSTSFLQNKDLDSMARNYAVFGARCSYGGLGAASLASAALGLHMFTSGCTDLKKGLYGAYGYAKPVVNFACKAGNVVRTASSAVRDGAVAVWNNPVGKALVIGAAGVGLVALGAYKADSIQAGLSSASNYLSATGTDLYARMTSSRPAAQAASVVPAVVAEAPALAAQPIDQVCPVVQAAVEEPASVVFADHFSPDSQSTEKIAEGLEAFSQSNWF